MYNYEHPSDLKTRPISQQNKSFIPFSRNPINFTRRPSFPSMRRRVMSGRCPNMNFRPVPRMYRPSCPVPRENPPDFMYHPTSNPVTGEPPAFQRPPRPSFPFAPPRIFENRTNRFPLPPRATTVSSTGSQISVESSEERNPSNEPNLFSDLWVEALAPRGRRYYYNARTREATWNKPMNVRIIELDEIKRLTLGSDIESDIDAQDTPKESQSIFVQQQPNNLCSNSFFPRPFAMPPRLVMLPPPQNVCNAQIFFTPSTEPIHDAYTFHFNPLVPPPILPFPVVTGNILPSNEIVGYNATVTLDEVNRNYQQAQYLSFTDDEMLSWSETKNTDFNVPDSNTLLKAFDNQTEINNSGKVIEGTMKEDCEESVSLKPENDILESSNPEDSGVAENERISNKPAKSECEDEQIDRSRPVSSTPISGTCWYVVWTGDDKVFFYDSHRKISVWERPSELMNRTDVDKLTEKSPLPVGLKAVKKEVRKISSDSSDTFKKFKTREENGEHSNLEQNREFNQKTMIENILKQEKGFSTQDFPHERKVEMFREMLAENKVSVSSTWEKEVHKIIFDSRYLLLSPKERKQAFQAYIKKKSEGPSDPQKEYQYRRERFVSLLEEAGLTSKSQFSDIARHYAKDVRFKAIEKIKQKESIFNQFISLLIKRERENEKITAEQKNNFIELLREQNCLNKNWLEVLENISNDERYKAVQNDSLREKIYNEFIQSASSDIPQDDEEENISSTVKDCEEEGGKQDVSVPMQEEHERGEEIHQPSSAVSKFKALLEDLILTSDIDWHSAKKNLQADNRWDCAQYLEPGKCEELFNEHIDSFYFKKRDQFHRLLSEVPDVTFKTSWLDVRKSILHDPRCKQFSTSERKCEKEFKEYLRKKFAAAKIEFKELLKETKLITSKSKSLLTNTKYLREIEKVLSQDKRYLNLDSMRSERREMLLSYIDKLHSEGELLPNRTKSGK